MARVVDVETPYTGKSEEEIKRNLLYARACLRDCFLRGETPFASHLLYTQPGILDDDIQEERMMGINAGKDLVRKIPGVITVVYEDLGKSTGMQYGIEDAEKNGRPVEYRTLGDDWEKKELELALKHSHAGIWGLNLQKQ